MSKLFAEKKGLFMSKTNEVVYKDVLRFFWVFLFVVLVLCDGSSVCADGGKGSDELVRRYVSDGLLLYNELVNESGSNFLKARKAHADLLGMYVREMKTRQLEYAANLLTDEAANILENLNSIRESLLKSVPKDQQNPNAWAEKDIKDASKRLGKILIGFEPYLKKPFDFDGFEKLGDECRKELDAALKEVKVKLGAYINDLTTKKADELTIKRAEELCQANRKTIVLLFLNRFARFEDQEAGAETSNKGLDLRVLRQFRGDINRTIYWNRVLKKKLKGSEHVSVLTAYSVSELRRLRVLQAVLDNDMREVQDLLLVAFKRSKPVFR